MSAMTEENTPPTQSAPPQRSAVLAHPLIRSSRNMLALLGLAAVTFVLAVALHSEWRQTTARAVSGWLEQEVQEVAETANDGAAQQAAQQSPLLQPGNAEEAQNASGATASNSTALDPLELTSEQLNVTYWLSRKYKVAPEPVGALVVGAWEIGAQEKIDPALILAVVAIESRFNPFAQSHAGAQGLMQVMTSVHTEKYEDFGGRLAAFDPQSNMRVGAVVLRDCIRRAGSVEDGLRWYVGAANLDSDGGYSAKVMAEYGQLQKVARGDIAPKLPPHLLASLEKRQKEDLQAVLATTAKQL